MDETSFSPMIPSPLSRDVTSTTTNKATRGPQYLAAITVCMGAVSGGTILGWTSPVLPQLTDPNSRLPITQDQGSWLAAIVAIGALFSAIPAGICADKFGRKLTLLALTGPFLINWALIILATNVYVLLVARFIAGISTGAICVLGPMYIGEFVEINIRGQLGSFFQMFIVVGVFISYFLGAYMNYIQLSIALAAIPVVFGVGFKFMPESPVYLMKVGKLSAAEHAIRWYRGRNYNVQPVLQEIQAQIDASVQKKASVKDLFTSRGNLRALISSLGLMLFQQLSGINAIIFYTVPIFQAAGSKLDPNLATILVGFVQIILAYVASVIIDKAGRKVFLNISAGLMTVSLAGLGFYFHKQEAGDDVSSLGLLPVGSILCFIIGFCLGYGPIPWMMMAELFAPEVRGVASGIAVMFNWILVFIVAKSFDILVTGLGQSITFFLFMACVILGMVFTISVLPETRGRSIQDIQDELNGVSSKKKVLAEKA